MRGRWRPVLIAVGLIATFTAATGSTQAATVRTGAYKYGDHLRQGIDAYWQVPENDATQPGLVLVHGGYWNSGGKADWGGTAQWFAEQGFAVFSVDHRYGNDAPWPAPRDDVIGAIEWLKAHAAEFRLDPDRVAVLGAEGGGQLAAQAGTYGSGHARVRGVVGLSAIASPKQAYDVAQTTAAPFAQRKIRDNTVLLARCTPASGDAACVARYTDMTVSAQVSADDAPMLLLHSAGDPVPASHGEDVRTALTAAGVTDVTVRALPGAGSGTALLDDQAVRQETAGWIKDRTAPRISVPEVTIPEKAAEVLLRQTPPVRTTDDGTGSPTSTGQATVDTSGQGTDSGAAPGAGAIADPPAVDPTAAAGPAGTWETKATGAAAGGTASVRTAATTRYEVTGSYGTNERQTVDVYYHRPAKPQPALLLVHGGYWFEGDKSGWISHARWFSDRGYAVFAINYRFSITDPWSAQRADVHAALAWIRRNAAAYKVDPKRVVMLGSSAGGQIATNAGTFGNAKYTFKAVAALSPVASPYRAYNEGQAVGASTAKQKLRDAAVLLARCTPDKSDTACWNRWLDLVSQNRAGAADSPLYTVHSAGDFVPPTHSSDLCKRLRLKKVSCTTVVVTGSDHSVTLLKVPGVRNNLVKWLWAHD